jgi:NADP-dependent 3-hydroxy acid dehydrogenase YdfG
MPTRPVALITGASAGIGEATARRLAAAGRRVILAARSKNRLEALAAHLDTAHGPGTAWPLELDVQDPEAWERVAAGLPADWADIDEAVLNAGLALNMVPAWENTVEEIDRMVDTNVKGVLHGVRALVPGMLERGRGHLVLIGSTAAHGTYPGGVIYAATKHAVRALALGLKMDLHGTPVRVSLVSPGLTETEFSLVRFEGDAGRAAPVYQDTVPLTGDDVAEAIVYALDTPARVNVQEVLMTPRVQSGISMIARGDAADALREG